LLQSDAFQEILKREIFAERHKVHFVVGRDDCSVIADDADAVIDMRLGFARARLVVTAGAGNQNCSRRNELGDACQYIRFPLKKKREGRFGPE